MTPNKGETATALTLEYSQLAKPTGNQPLAHRINHKTQTLERCRAENSFFAFFYKCDLYTCLSAIDGEQHSRCVALQGAAIRESEREP